MAPLQLTSHHHHHVADESATVDWRDAERAPLAFACRLIQLTRRHPMFRDRDWMQDRGDIVWMQQDGTAMDAADWRHGTRVVGALLDGFFVAINASEELTSFRLPAAPGGRVWERVFDSDRGAGTVTVKMAPLTRCSVSGHSVVVFRRRG